ncbi:MAG: PRC-barrel domain-containing protein [bacterium]
MKDEFITTDDILGKDVIDKDGEIIGIVQQIHIDKESKGITGITIDEGFLKPDLFIGINYIKLFGIDSVMLNIAPDQTFKGILVFDSKGKKVGTVSRVFTTMRSGKVKSIEVKNHTKKEIVAAKDIKSIGMNVILKR